MHVDQPVHTIHFQMLIIRLLFGELADDSAATREEKRWLDLLAIASSSHLALCSAVRMVVVVVIDEPETREERKKMKREREREKGEARDRGEKTLASPCCSAKPDFQ